MTMGCIRKGLMLLAAMWLTFAQAQTVWTPFTWATLAQPEMTIDHAAVLLPVQLDGKPCMMQLDTGAASSVLYRPKLPASYAVSGATLVVNAFGIGTRQMRRTFSLMYEDDPAHRESGCRDDHGARLAGTLGNDAFADGSLALDLRNARFRFTPGAAPAPGKDAVSLPLDLLQPAGGRGQVPALDATLGGGRHVRLLVDTGSAPMELTVFHEADWLAIVGAGAHDAVIMKSMAWGQSVICRMAPILQTVQIGPIVLAAPSKATYCTGANGPLHDSQPEFGLLGLVPFHDKVMIFDYVGRRLLIGAPASP